MTDISKNNIINRWKRIATTDLGYYITDPATAIWHFFERILNDETDGKYYDNHVDEGSAYWINGFKASGVSPVYCSIAFAYDLHSCTMTERGIEMFDRWLMGQAPYIGCDRNFLKIWQTEVLTA